MPDVVEVGFDAVEQEDRGQDERQRSDHAQASCPIGELIEVRDDLVLAGRQELVEEKLLDLLLDVVERPERREDGERHRNEWHSGEQRRVGQTRSPDDHLVAIELPERHLGELDHADGRFLPLRKIVQVQAVQLVEGTHGRAILDRFRE